MKNKNNEIPLLFLGICLILSGCPNGETPPDANDTTSGTGNFPPTSPGNNENNPPIPPELINPPISNTNPNGDISEWCTTENFGYFTQGQIGTGLGGVQGVTEYEGRQACHVKTFTLNANGDIAVELDYYIYDYGDEGPRALGRGSEYRTVGFQYSVPGSGDTGNGIVSNRHIVDGECKEGIQTLIMNGAPVEHGAFEVC